MKETKSQTQIDCGRKIETQRDKDIEREREREREREKPLFQKKTSKQNKLLYFN